MSLSWPDILAFGLPIVYRKLRRALQIDKALEETLNLKDGVPKELSKCDYYNGVTKLLNFTEKRFCTFGRSCNLLGTTVFLPSEWMSDTMSIYRVIWEKHARLVGKQVEKGRYHAVRIICTSHQKLIEEVRNYGRSGDLCDQFFQWCKRTNFKVRVLVKNYEQLIKGQGINLQDFMVFNNKFVFGSENRPTENLIKCLMCCKSDILCSYSRASETFVNDEHSREVTSAMQLLTLLKSTKSWD